MDEFELITRCFGARTVRRRGTVLGIGDDAALLDTGGLPLAHARATAPFAGGDDAGGIAREAFGAAFIRLAARAVTPRWATLGLTLEAIDPDWVERFAAATAAICEASGVELIGGDTTRGPGRATVFALGTETTLAHEPATGVGSALLHELAPGTGTRPAPRARVWNGKRPSPANPRPEREAPSPREPASGTGSALPYEPAPTQDAEVAVRLSLDASTSSPEHALADIVSACAALAVRGAEIRRGKTPEVCEPGRASRTLEIAARIEAQGLRALRATADHRRISTTSPDESD